MLSIIVLLKSSNMLFSYPYRSIVLLRCTQQRVREKRTIYPWKTSTIIRDPQGGIRSTPKLRISYSHMHIQHSTIRITLIDSVALNLDCLSFYLPSPWVLTLAPFHQTKCLIQHARTSLFLRDLMLTKSISRTFFQGRSSFIRCTFFGLIRCTLQPEVVTQVTPDRRFFR